MPFFLKKSLKQRLIVSFLLVSLIPIAIVLLLSFYRDKNVLINTRIGGLESIASLKAAKIAMFFDERRDDISVAQNYYNIKTNLPVLSKYRNERSNKEYIKAKEMLDGQLKTFQDVYSYKDIKLLNEEGIIVYCSDEEHELMELDTILSGPDGKAFLNGKKGLYISNVCRSIVHKNKYIIFVTAPVQNFEGKFIGLIAFEVMMDTIHNTIHDDTGLGSTGETILAKIHNNDEIVFLNPLRYDKDATLKKKLLLGSNTAIPTQEAVQGHEGSGIYRDYRNVEVLAAWKYIPSLNWGLVTKIDTDDAFKTFKAFWFKLIWLAVFIFSLVAFIAYLLTKQISSPITKLTASTEIIANGDLTKRIDIQAKDEIGQLAQSFNKMSETLQFRDEKLQQQQEELKAINDELARSSQEAIETNKKLLEEIRDRQKTEDAIKQHQESLIMLAGYGYSSDNLLFDFTRIISSAINVQYVSIWILVDSGKRLRCLDHYDRSSKKHDSGTELSQIDYPTYFKSIERDTIIAVDDALTAPNLCEMVDLHLKPRGVKTVLDIPFSVLGERNGILQIENVDETRKWQSHEQSFAVAAAEMLSLKFEQIRRKKVEDELIMLNNAVEQSADMIFITDTEGVIEYVNPAVQKGTFYEPEEMIGNKMSILKSAKHDKKFYKNMWNTIKLGKIWQGRLTNKKKDGVFYDENMTISPVKSKDNRVTHFVAIKNDISEIIKNENELKQAKEFAENTAEDIKNTLKESEKLRSIAEKAKEQALEFAEQAKEANESKSEFLANMSHELRTPLNGIIGLTDIMLNTSLTKEQEKNLNLILFSGKSLLSLVNDILDLSKIEEGRIVMDKHEFNLHETIEYIAEQQSFPAYMKGLELIDKICNGVPKLVIGDARRVTEVLINLIGNAIKFTDKGEILLETDLILNDGNSQIVHFHVKDTGIGISQNKQDKIFERFTQADSSTLRKYGGAGLGITISKSLVELMGGKIWVESELKKGSDFNFTIKFDLPENAKEVKLISDERVKGLKVLISVHNSTNMELLSGLMKSWDCNVITENRFDKMREILINGQRENSPVDLLLVDYHTEELCLIKHIRKISESKNTKIIYLTNRISGSATQAVKFGANAALNKPVKKLELLNVIIKTFQDNPMEKEEKQEGRSESIKGEELKIILAEDNLVNQEVGKSTLKILGHQCTIAENGKDTIAAWQQGGYDLILMDVHMPMMDGLEATALIRELEEKKIKDGDINSDERIPIIAMTACAMDGDKEKCLGAGMDDYISKPFNIEQLRECIKRNISKKEVEEIPKPDNTKNESVEESPYNLDNLNILLDNDKDTIKKIIQKFIESTEKNISNLEPAIQNKDAREIQHIAHTIKGASSQLGAKELTNIAFGLEVNGKENNMQNITEGFEKLSNAFNKVKISITKEL